MSDGQPTTNEYAKIDPTKDDTNDDNNVSRNNESIYHKSIFWVGIVIVIIIFGLIIALLVHFIRSNDKNNEQVSTWTDIDTCVNDRYLILISFDGFQWGYYFNQTWKQKYNVTTPYMDLLVNNGTYVKNVIPVFPTYTFPSHVSMATGLYPGDHGIIANSFYDKILDERFAPSTSDKTGKWYQGIPIWQTMKSEENKAKFNNLGLTYKDKSAAIFWVGTDHNMSGNGYPDFWMSYDGSFPFETRIDTVIELLNTTEYRLLITYFNQPDKSGHIYGPDSIQVANSVMEMDDLLGRLINGIQSLGNNMWDKTDIMIVSDHGMTQVNTENNIIIKKSLEFDLWNDDDNFIIVQTASNLMFSLTNNSTYTINEAIELLKNHTQPKDKYQVWSKHTIPYEYKTSYHDRIPDIIASADLGYLFRFDNISLNDQRWLTQKGTHGYNNSEYDMRSLFIGYGPSFKNGYTQETAKSLDYYELMCQLLCGLIPSPNNGSITSIKDVLSIHYN